MYYGSGWIITANTISNHSGTGVYLFDSSSCEIYYNDFGWNSWVGLELNSAGSNLWDDNVSMGNYYVGYDPASGPYPITNDTINIVNYDRYPMASFWIEPEIQESYEYATSGNTLTLTAFAASPSYYEIVVNGSIDDTFSWDGNSIVLDFDNFSVGFHEIVVKAYHIFGEYVSASGNVTVSDTIAPTWTVTPEDQSVFWGFAFSYQLGAFDASDLGTWSVNDTRFSITDGLLINATLLEAGTYHIRISIDDIYGNLLYIDISVTQLEQPTDTTTTDTTTTDTTTTDTTTTDTSPTDEGLGITMLVIGVAGAGVVVVVVILILKKRQ